VAHFRGAEEVKMTHFPHKDQRCDPSLPLAMWIFAIVVAATLLGMVVTSTPVLHPTIDPSIPATVSKP
jgi:hypothetical protein